MAIASMFSEYMPIQLVPSDCSSRPPFGSGALRSKTPMLSRPRKPPSNTLLPSASFRLTHQVKLRSSFWNTRSRNSRSPVRRPLLVDLVDAPRRPRVHRRVGVPERPLVGGKLTVGVHVPFAQQQHELLLRELRIDNRERDAVERQIPGRVPRVLPLVGHGQDVRVEHLRPGSVPALVALDGRRRERGVSLEPVAHDVVVVLLRPQQPGQRLAHDRAFVVAERSGDHRGVELVCLG